MILEPINRSTTRLIETFEKLTFKSLREAKRRGNLVDYQYVVRLLRFARNDNIGVLQRSPIIGEPMKKNFLDITELIRSIQRAEGNVDCFGRPHGICDRLDCAWRRYCLETQQPVFFEKDGQDKKEELKHY